LSAPAAPKAATVSLRLDLPTGRIGPGKVALLEAIEREGSISAAGRALGMSYRRAWRLVDEVNRVLGAQAVAAATGGRGGGGASLTDAGRGLVRDYRAMELAAHAAAARLLDSLARRAGG
jgi:molybdate transport system regulatory protein